MTWAGKNALFGVALHEVPCINWAGKNALCGADPTQGARAYRVMSRAGGMWQPWWRSGALPAAPPDRQQMAAALEVTCSRLQHACFSRLLTPTSDCHFQVCPASHKAALI